MANTWITSDLHFFHKKIMDFCPKTRPWSTVEEMNEAILDHLNTTVKKGDTLYLLGDISFGNAEQTHNIVKKLPGQKYLVLGNHDQHLQSTLIRSYFNHVSSLLEHKLFGHKVVMCHYPLLRWNRCQYGSFHLFGHCVDMQTQILTLNGWKYRDEILVGDKILSLNTDNGKLEEDCINEIVDQRYTGVVVGCDGKAVNFRVTNEHTIIYKSKYNGRIKKTLAKDLSPTGRTVFITSAQHSLPNYALTDNMVKLYIIIAADGAIKKETSLCRVKVKKERKIVYLKKVLSDVGVPYNEYLHKDGYTSINFYIPNELLTLDIKGLDKSILLFGEQQAAAVFEAYSNSDGSLLGNSLIVYSAKEREIDLLQQMFFINGYQTKKYSRNNGFGSNTQHQLCVTKKSTSSSNGKLYEEAVDGEPFWCVKTNNQTWVMRRAGCVHVTGNCHGNDVGATGRCMDVGWDAHGKILNMEDVITELSKRESTNHHGNIKG